MDLDWNVQRQKWETFPRYTPNDLKTQLYKHPDHVNLVSRYVPDIYGDRNKKEQIVRESEITVAMLAKFEKTLSRMLDLAVHEYTAAARNNRQNWFTGSVSKRYLDTISEMAVYIKKMLLDRFCSQTDKKHFNSNQQAWKEKFKEDVVKLGDVGLDMSIVTKELIELKKQASKLPDNTTTNTLRKRWAKVKAYDDKTAAVEFEQKYDLICSKIKLKPQLEIKILQEYVMAFREALEAYKMYRTHPMAMETDNNSNREESTSLDEASLRSISTEDMEIKSLESILHEHTRPVKNMDVNKLVDLETARSWLEAKTPAIHAAQPGDHELRMAQLLLSRDTGGVHRTTHKKRPPHEPEPSSALPSEEEDAFSARSASISTTSYKGGTLAEIMSTASSVFREALDGVTLCYSASKGISVHTANYEAGFDPHRTFRIKRKKEKKLGNGGRGASRGAKTNGRSIVQQSKPSVSFGDTRGRSEQDVASGHATDIHPSVPSDILPPTETMNPTRSSMPKDTNTGDNGTEALSPSDDSRAPTTTEDSIHVVPDDHSVQSNEVTMSDLGD